jgi:hypothetical protein
LCLLVEGASLAVMKEPLIPGQDEVIQFSKDYVTDLVRQIFGDDVIAGPFIVDIKERNIQLRNLT